MPIIQPPAIVQVSVDECELGFHNNSRTVLLNFSEGGVVRVSLRVPDHIMAQVTGHFIKVRLFGLH